jgi:hypothetical protein
VALAEIAIKSGVGVVVEGLDGSALFDETPLRFVAIGQSDPNTAEAHRRIGTVGGSAIDFGSAGSIDLAEATDIWRNAIPRRMM